MAFMKSGNTVISFAQFSDVTDRDSRLFEANEGLTEDVVEGLLIRSTERILSKIRASEWWQNYYVNRNSAGVRTSADIPEPDINKILFRENDFTDLCVYTAMGEYILPMVADFGTEDNAERQKMGYYVSKADGLFAELITAGDWYDFDGTGSISSDERSPGYYNLRRVR